MLIRFIPAPGDGGGHVDASKICEDKEGQIIFIEQNHHRCGVINVRLFEGIILINN